MSSRMLHLLYMFVPRTYYLGAAESLRSGGTLLEIGCGRGLLLEEVEDRFEYLVGVDIDEYLLGMARRSPKVDVVFSSGCSLPLRDSSFDNAVFHDSLHHLEIPEKGITEACRVLKRGGRLYVFDFNLDRFSIKVLSLLERLFGFPAKFFGKEALVSLLEKCLKIVEEEEGRIGDLKIVGVKT